MVNAPSNKSLNWFVRWIYYGVILSIILGPLGEIPLSIEPINLYITDLLMVILLITMVVNRKEYKRIYYKNKVYQSVLLFAASGIISLFFTPLRLNSLNWTISSLYLIRYFIYSLIFVFTLYVVQKKIIQAYKIKKLLIFVGIALAIVGWFQYVFYPDLRNLYYLGWDPHNKRIFSTFLDPNFLGILLTLALIQVFSFIKKYFITIPLMIFLLISLVFTYSRSTFIALISLFIYFGYKTNRTILMIILSVVFLGSLFLLPRKGGESVRLERRFTIADRIQNWQDAAKIIIRYPVTGVGFNTLRYAKKEAGLLDEDWLISHSGAGFDNSFLFVLATTGIIGFIFFVNFLYKIFIFADMEGKMTLIALCVHSLFLNSLFFSFIMIWLWITIATSRK